MDKRMKKFTLMSLSLIFLLLLVLIFFSCIYLYSTLSTYNAILLVLMLLTAIIILFSTVLMIIILVVYAQGHVGMVFILPLKLGLRVLLPLIISVSGFAGSGKSILREFYITVNNIFVQSRSVKYAPDQILLLLPHCLQNSECAFKVTKDLRNCNRCGRCCMGEIAEIVEKTGVMSAVVTGGTAARNTVDVYKPEFILSVACERDLTSGILEVGSIPVIGIMNERPNGPCNNTVVNVNLLKEKLESVLKIERIDICRLTE